MTRPLRLATLPVVLALVAGCQTLAEKPPATEDVPPPAAAQQAAPQAAITHPAPAVDRAALIQRALASYSTVSSEPILRIDNGAHIRAIHALALQPRGNLLATASVDRTVRVWDRNSGEARDVLRPPMSAFGLGTMDALAFSPDGKLLAAGGLSYFSRRPASLKQAEFTVYFFDVAQSGIARTLDDVPGRVHHLAWSASGRQLAVAYGAEPLPGLGSERLVGTSGVRIYDAQSLTLQKEITTDSPCEWAEFDAAQRLYAACRSTLLALDERGSLRLREAPHDAPFYRGALAPDGHSLALSYFGRARAELLAADDLATLQTMDIDADFAASHGDLQLAWSPGGMFLYAGGRRLSLAVKENHLLKWDRAGTGHAERVPAGQVDVLDLLAARDGRLLFATSNGSVGVLDAQDKAAILVDDRTVSSGNRPGALWVSADGKTVAYSDDDDGQQRFVYSHDKRTLTPWAEFKGRDALLPAETRGRIEVRDWQLSRRIVCNGTAIDLGERVAQNLALLKSGAGFAIGTDDSVLFFDADCRRVWENRTLGRTLALTSAEDGGFVLAQDEAGVIRWLRIEDGVKVMSIYTARGGRSWTAWTPEGFYDASPEGENLVGWHLNRGRARTADFYGASRFRELFHNPAEINAALRPASADSARAADQKAARLAEIHRQMQAGLPPQVTILGVRETQGPDGPVALVEYKLRTPSGEPVQRVRALINGRPAGVVQEFAATAAATQAADAESGTLRLRVPLPSGEVELGLIAESRGAVSELERVRLAERLAAAPARSNGEQIKPRLYALVVGVGAYPGDAIPRLDFPAKDARDFAAELRSQSGRLYRDVDVRLLEDADATRENVIEGLDWLRRQVTANDLAVLFLAGHGINDSSNRYYFVPVNADPARLRSTAVPNSDITEALQALPSKVLAFLDTCHAGNVLGSSKQRNLAVGGNGDINRLVNELTSAENGVVVFASSTGRESSQESADWNNGAFTKALVEGLSGRADFNGDGVVSLNELNLYVADRVKELTNGDQHANMIRPDSIRDFPFALKK